MVRPTFKNTITTTTLAVVMYTILRAALAWNALGDYGVNPWIFLALDIITVLPYVWGIGKMVQGVRGVDSLKMMYIGGLFAITSFLIPYIYVYVAGRAMMPMSTKIIIVVIIVALFIVGPLREVVKKVRIGKACDIS